MIIGSIKEDLSLEKRVSLTPESAKNIISLGLKVCVEKDYALHLGLNDKDYTDVGVIIKESQNDVFQSSNLLTKVNCPTDSEIEKIKENTILIGMMNPSKNQNLISKILKKKKLIYFLWSFYRVSQEHSQWMYCHHNQIWQAIDLLLTQFLNLKKQFL